MTWKAGARSGLLLVGNILMVLASLLDKPSIQKNMSDVHLLVFSARLRDIEQLVEK